MKFHDYYEIVNRAVANWRLKTSGADFIASEDWRRLNLALERALVHAEKRRLEIELREKIDFSKKYGNTPTRDDEIKELQESLAKFSTATLYQEGMWPPKEEG